MYSYRVHSYQGYVHPPPLSPKKKQIPSSRICIPQQVLSVHPKYLPRAYDDPIVNHGSANIYEGCETCSFVTALENNHQHIEWYFILMSSSIVFCAYNPCKVFVLRLQQLLHVFLGDMVDVYNIPKRNYVHDPIWLQCEISRYNPDYMGVSRHEYLKFHMRNIILNHYLIEGFPNHNWELTTSSNCMSRQLIINTS